MIKPDQLNKMKFYIRDNLRSIRKNARLSTRNFAIRCDVSCGTIQRIEKGNLPFMLTTYKLIDALKLPEEKV